MKQLGELNYYKISQGVKCEGSYDPKLISCYFIEDLYVDEVDTILDFLQWCHDNNKTFGRGNYEEVFSDFLQEYNQDKEFYVLGENSINGIKISETIRDEELFEYNIIDREDFITGSRFAARCQPCCFHGERGS